MELWKEIASYLGPYNLWPIKNQYSENNTKELNQLNKAEVLKFRSKQYDLAIKNSKTINATDHNDKIVLHWVIDKDKEHLIEFL